MCSQRLVVTCVLAATFTIVNVSVPQTPLSLAQPLTRQPHPLWCCRVVGKLAPIIGGVPESAQYHELCYLERKLDATIAAKEVSLLVGCYCGHWQRW
jgi:hypothetical protein